MRIVQLAVLLALGTAAVAQAQNAPVSGQDMFFFGKNGPVLIRVQIEIDGKSAPETFRNYLKKLFAYYDRDGDGFLSAQELQFFPKANNAVTLFYNGFNIYNPNFTLKMSDLGKGENDKASLDDLAAYLEKIKIGPFQQAPYMQQALIYAGGMQKAPPSMALFKILDTDGDGKLSKKEILAAWKVLKKYDLNDDELITQAELTGGASPAFYGQQFLIKQGGFDGGSNAGTIPLHLISPSAQAQSAALLMARYDKDKDFRLSLVESGLDQATFNKLDRNQDGSLSITEILHWAEVVEPVTVVVRAGKVAADQPAVAVLTPAAKLPKGVQVGTAGPGLAFLLLDEAKLSFHGMGNTQQMMMSQFAGTNGYFLNLFKMASQGKNFVQLKDLQAIQYKPLASAFEMLDRNGDGKLTEAELQEYLTLVDGARHSYTSVKISEEGQDLFQILDVNKDGKLSQRELINAWEVLSQLDRNKDGFLTPDEFNQQYVFTAGPGQLAYNGGLGNQVVFNPQMMAPPPPANKGGKTGPLWFQKMDVNGDGDVSPREFLGSRELFQKMDLNGDGLIDAEEAWKADAWFTKKTK